MKMWSWAKRNVTTLAVVVPIVIILLPIGYSSARALLSIGDDDDVFLVIPPEAGTACVRDTEYMRFHHMNLLKEVRDRAQRDGVRGTINFATCRTCHYNRETFCNRCHDAVNLAPDCFGCHFYPDNPPEWEER